MDFLGRRSLLQAAVFIFAFVPIVAGAGGVFFGLDFAGPPMEPPQESHFRYLSGLLLGIGLGFWSTIAKIERQGPRFTLLTAIVFGGGFARLFGLAVDGNPGGPMLFGLAMELVVTPTLWIWQRAIARGSL